MSGRKLDLNIVQLVAGTAAAVSAAFVAATLGVAGTVIGAAVASLVAGVGSSLYTHSLERAKHKFKEVRGLPEFEGSAGSPLTDVILTDLPTGVTFNPGASDGSTSTQVTQKTPLSSPGPDRSELATRVIRPAVGVSKVYSGTLYEYKAPRRAVPLWASITVASIVVFALSLGTITFVERLLIGKSMSSIFGKDDRDSTLFGGPASRSDPAQGPPQTPSEPEIRSPTASPSQIVSPSPTPSGAPSPKASGSPSTSITPSPSPSAPAHSASPGQ